MKKPHKVVNRRSKDEGPLSYEDCEMLSRKFELLLRRGQWEAAREIVDEAKRLCVIVPTKFTLNTHLSDTEIASHMRLVDMLELHGITTVSHVLAQRRDQLLEIRQLGPKSINILIKCAKGWAERLQKENT